MARSQPAKALNKPRSLSTSVLVRFDHSALAAVDRWARLQSDGLGRPEAIRQLVELGLSLKPQRAGAHKGASRATELAGEEIDRSGDASATHEQRASRKRRLLQGPKEFRSSRRDHSHTQTKG
jgi:hypothetical protein